MDVLFFVGSTYDPFQPDQINMAVLFWYLVIGDASAGHYTVAYIWASHVLQGTRLTRPCITGHPVCIY